MAATEELFKNPIHPYTKSLLSAVPVPDPEIEREKGLVVYDPSMHNYDVEEPSFVEITPGHFVWASPSEVEAYRAELD
jgi:oligopeptide transport system ATP-binding protein